MPICFRRRIDVRGVDGIVFLSSRNMTAPENVVVKNKTVIGKAELTDFVFEPIFVEQRGEASEIPFEQTNRIHTVDLKATSSEFSTFA